MNRNEAINKLLEEKFTKEIVKEECNYCNGSGTVRNHNKNGILDVCPKCYARGYEEYVKYTDKKTIKLDEKYLRLLDGEHLLKRDDISVELLDWQVRSINDQQSEVNCYFVMMYKNNKIKDTVDIIVEDINKQQCMESIAKHFIGELI